ncbi:MAG: diaminopimelate epimerase [Pseudomonadota bacterium]
MTQSTQLGYLKMNGLGNDFVVLDARAKPIALGEEQVRAISNRETGIGCDQMLVMEKPPAGADVFMRIYNADGGETEACGNGTRCIGRLILDETGKSSVKIATVAGVLIASNGMNGTDVTVDMGVPKLKWDEIPLAEPFHDTRTIELQLGPIDAPLLHSPAVVNNGVPHAIFFVDDLNCVDLGKAGPMLEHHPIFPQGANIALARVDARDAITSKVWERGAGLTQACGTSACATAVAAIRRRLTDRVVTIRLPGGPLQIEWRENDEHVLMTGPAQTDGEGILPEHLMGESVDAG